MSSGTWKQSSVPFSQDGVYTDKLGVEWSITKGGLLRNPFTAWRASVKTKANVYGLATGKTFYSEDSLAAVQTKIDDACYAFRVQRGDLAPEKPESDNSGLIWLAVAAAVILLGKKR